MTNPEALSVDADEVRAHAERLEGLMSGLTLSLEAAAYLRNCDDGYGNIPRPFVKMVLDDNLQGAYDAIKKLSEEVAQLPGNLQTVATTFEDADGSFAKALADLQTQLTEAGG